MPGSLQNKLQQFEVAPPPAVWNNIARRLDEEFVTADSRLSEKLDEASVNAPSEIWQKISDELNGETDVEVTPRKVVPLFVRIAVAAAIIGILFVGGLYFLNSNPPENNVVNTVPKKTTRPATVTEPLQPKLPDTGSSTVIASNKKQTPKLKKESYRPVPRPRIVDEEIPSASEYAVNPEQAPLYDLQTVSALQPVSVTAPPLRDKKGNIILDASLISNPDDEYITVTGPNGKQTKISSKFLSCLGYINATGTSYDADTRAIQCKTQFEEWRKRLIAQPAFIPTANNFFDIFALKDLLQEM
jgi:hypothetical protein